MRFLQAVVSLITFIAVVTLFTVISIVEDPVAAAPVRNVALVVSIFGVLLSILLGILNRTIRR